MSIRHYIALIVIAFGVTFVLTPLVRNLSIKLGLVVAPGKRKIHKKPIPQTGGIAMFLGMAVAIGVQIYGEMYLGWKGMFVVDGAVRIEALGVFAGITLVFLVGLIDDIIDMGAGIKFLGQIAAALIVVACGVSIDFIGNPFGGLLYLGWWAYPITIIYIVSFANIMNLIDGMDGLAAGITVIAAGSLFFLAANLNRLDAATLAIVLVGVCVAFLCYNFNPASIFMGDSGALTLGFTLATISLLGVMRSTATIALFIPMIIIGIPILDTASSIIRRVKGNQPFHKPDKGHIHHRLLNRGFSQRQTVIIIWIWSFILAVGGYIVSSAPSVLKIVAFVVLVVLSILFMNWLDVWSIAYHHPKHGTRDEAGHDAKNNSE